MTDQLKLNRKALLQLLRTDEVRHAVAECGEDVARRARDKADVDIIVVNAGQSRARTYVSIASAAYEVKHRPILSSV